MFFYQRTLTVVVTFSFNGKGKRKKNRRESGGRQMGEGMPDMRLNLGVRCRVHVGEYLVALSRVKSVLTCS